MSGALIQSAATEAGKRDNPPWSHDGYPHPLRFTKQGLACHLTYPHGTRSMADDVRALMRWRKDELVRQHQEFHDGMAKP